jgi:hypothetical protein
MYYRLVNVILRELVVKRVRQGKLKVSKFI